VLSDIGLEMHYRFNKKCGIHEVFCCYDTDFLENDERLTNRRYHAVLDARIGKGPFPTFLADINHYVRTPKEAREVSDALSEYFPDDENLSAFAKWLQTCARVCTTYELYKV
jgi:hypothetical protein